MTTSPKLSETIQKLDGLVLSEQFDYFWFTVDQPVNAYKSKRKRMLPLFPEVVFSLEEVDEIVQWLKKTCVPVRFKNGDVERFAFNIQGKLYRAQYRPAPDHTLRFDPLNRHRLTAESLTDLGFEITAEREVAEGLDFISQQVYGGPVSKLSDTDRDNLLDLIKRSIAGSAETSTNKEN